MFQPPPWRSPTAYAGGALLVFVNDGATNRCARPAQPPLTSWQSPYRFQAEIQAMMSTAGDVRQPSAATSQLMESIVRTELIRLVWRLCLAMANESKRCA